MATVIPVDRATTQGAAARASRARIRELDFIRGLAILGMLIPNIPWHAGDSMSRVTTADVTSVGAWLLQYVVFDQRFHPLFCMLFGAGVLLLADRREEKGFAPYFLIRMGLLLVIGIAHAYILWPGDILITYAMCAPILLVLRKSNAGVLIAIAVVLKSVHLVFGEWPGVYSATIERVLFSWWVDIGPAPSTIGEAYAGSYADLFAYNAWRNQFLQWTALPYFRMWNALAFMLTGMALFKIGILQGARSERTYRRIAAGALLVGGPLVFYGVLARIGINETVGPYLGIVADLPLRNLTFAVGCAATSFAVLAGAHLAYRRIGKGAAEAVERVGRMALTNYVMHSALFLVVFHFAELLPFDTLDHDAMLALVVLTWGLQLLTSWLWLSRFRQGPLEAAWRSASDALSGYNNGRGVSVRRQT